MSRGIGNAPGYAIGHYGHKPAANLPAAVRRDYLNYPHEIYPALRGLGNMPGYAIQGSNPPGYHIHGMGCGCAGVGADADGNPQVSMRAPTELREFPIGFDSASDVASNATVTISTQIQVPFRAKRLVVDPNIAAAFFINNIFVGTDFQGASTVNLPASMFVPESLAPLQLTTAQVGNTITLSVTNRSLAPLRFLAGMIGDVLRA